jgi:Flp pilus assembly protein TadG
MHATTRRNHPCRRRDDLGAAAVEFALVVPVLIMLLLGTLTSGISYSHSVGVTNAVREGSRFGATADASSSVAAAWADNVISRVRDTQFDDPGHSDTTICVQLWKVGTGAIADTAKCSTPTGAPALTVPATATDEPAVPANATGTCVVRVLAARRFTINIGLYRWDPVGVTSSVARYERKDKVSTCA